jgi:RTX calcium-binding nonapeptide repeat (4 copies)
MITGKHPNHLTKPFKYRSHGGSFWYRWLCPDYAANHFKVLGISAVALLTQGQIEFNKTPLTETKNGVVKAFGTCDYVIGAQAATFPLRSGGVPGNSVFGNPGFGFLGVPPENNLITGGFVADAQNADLLKRISKSVVSNTAASDPIQGRKIPGTDAALNPILRNQLEAEKVIGIFPDALLPMSAFNFAFNPVIGAVDLSKFTRTFDLSSINDDLIVGGSVNDFIIGGPGNDIIVGGFGNHIIWAGAGKILLWGEKMPLATLLPTRVWAIFASKNATAKTLAIHLLPRCARHHFS